MLDKLLIALVPLIPFIALFIFLAKKVKEQIARERQQGIIRSQDELWGWMDEEEEPDYLTEPAFSSCTGNIYHNSDDDYRVDDD
ncbi:MAG: hypothetical protein QW561_01820 [Candidatus Aenigmatarchaeota archaeon]